MEDKFFEPIIGLEVHVELKTNSKMFCGCSADYFGHKPNTHCCPVCLGLPGALPVPNKKAIEWCIMIGLALNCKVNEESYFERKNYFYPDLPKGYQISQYHMPLCVNGWLDIYNSPSRSPYGHLEGVACRLLPGDGIKRIRINRVHMEEDTGKLLHTTIDGEKCTLIDFNRSGVPLVEIVTEPDFRSSEEVVAYLKKIQKIIRYLGVSDADMEKGSMRLEPNISIRVVEGTKLPNYRVEIKNINSFRFVKKAIDYEINRQIELLKQGETLTFETRGFDEDKGITYAQRTKEEAHDYRYFPEPDIPPMIFGDEDIRILGAKIPELPDKKVDRFMRQYELSEYDAVILTETRETADYYEKAVSSKQGAESREITPKVIANWVINKRVDINRVSPEELIKMIAQKTQTVSMSDEELEEVIKKVVTDNPKAVADYKFGKEQAIMFLVGQIMRRTKGQAEAGKVKEMLIKILKNPRM